MDNTTLHNNGHGAHGHAEHGHAELHPKATPNKANISASFWFAILLIALFIAGVNFVGIMASGHGEGEGKGTIHEKQETTSNGTAQDHNREDVISEDKEHANHAETPATTSEPAH